jgi:hypothetical protein
MWILKIRVIRGQQNPAWESSMAWILILSERDSLKSPCWKTGDR